MNRCRGCGQSTGDRHLYCWYCRKRRMRARLVAEPLALVCDCARPVPEPVPIFGGVQCRRCGRRIVP